MTDAPPPLVPAEVDLRDFPEFPLQFERLFASDTWIICNPEEKVAALRLWCKSWHQEPAGSLPMNDRLLANLAGYGEAVMAWMKVKDHAMLGWTRCSDGRYYHPVVGEIAVAKWEKKKHKRAENTRDRERKRRKTGGVPPEHPAENEPIPPESIAHSAGNGAVEYECSAGIPPENALKGKGREENKKRKKDSVPNGTDAAASLEAEVFRRGKALLGKNAGGQITKLRRAFSLDDVAALAILNEAETKENKGEWIAGVIRNHAAGNELDTDALYKSWGVEI
jgi:hypothetical protein